MKTITIDDIAYERLKAWKNGPKESFSNVVKRVVPEAGTLGAFLNFVDSQGTANLPNNDLLEASIEERSAEKPDPWN
ncbi:MAG: antitoxin VapB family protein [Luteolibacter sp.]